MKIEEIIIGDRVLIQKTEYVREHAKVKEVDEDAKIVLVELSDRHLHEIKPEYILKSFGQP